ncbi:MAG: hypothetical protein GY810_24660 [Aureispira sp.]|nr:hypothetical protein [Aureispira sp.]
MKKLSILFIALMGLCAFSMTTKDVTTATELKKLETIKGEFRSVAGVMNPLSCYCSEGGYITVKTPEEEGRKKIAVCFKSKNPPTKACKNIEVTGKYKTLKRKSNPNSPCPGGEKRVLMVKTHNCY